MLSLSHHTSQGMYEEAEPLCIRSLAIDKRAYGPDHPEVAADLDNLAVLLKGQVRAIALFSFPSNV